MAGYEQIMSARHQQVAEQLQLGESQVRQIRQLVARRITPVDPAFGQKALGGLLQR